MSESIYDWIKEEPAAAAKPARYKSSFDPTAPLTGSTIGAPKKAAGTIGRSVKDTIRPGEFQRTTDKSLPERTLGTMCDVRLAGVYRAFPVRVSRSFQCQRLGYAFLFVLQPPHSREQRLLTANLLCQRLQNAL